MYDQLLASDFYVPKWVRRYHTEYHTPAEEAENEVSDESDDGHESDGAVGDVAAVFENDDERDLHAARVGGRFYQTALDEMMACNPEDMDVVTPRINREAASVSNPDGYDFQAHWLGDRVVNPDHVWRNCARLAALGAADAAHAAPITPAGRQRVLPFIVRRYLTAQREWRRSHREWDAYDQAVKKWRHARSSRNAEPAPPTVDDIRHQRPKPLRAFLLGDPGAGKSTTLQAAVHDLHEMLADDAADWTDVVKLSAPTGCASFHMAHGATTIHRLYGIRVGQTGDEPMPRDSQRFARLCERLGPELGLIIFDEFSMIQRRMLRWVVSRLEEAGVNLEDIGVLFVGDRHRFCRSATAQCGVSDRRRMTAKTAARLRFSAE